MNSKLLWLNLGDFERGLIVAVLSAVLTVIYQSVSTGSFVINWTSVLAVAAASGISYILKNLGTNSEGKILKTDPK